MEDNSSTTASDPQTSAAQLEVKFMENTTSNIMELREEISDLITPWLESEEKPPFTTGELAVFALVYSDYPLGADDIHFWILNTFTYYEDRALKGFVRCTKGQHGSCSGVVDQFPRALREFDLPVHITTRADDYEYCIDTGPARVYLRQWLEPARQGTFRFLDLSAELRNRVYELLLKISDDELNQDFQFNYTSELQLLREEWLPLQLAEQEVDEGEEAIIDDPFYGKPNDFILHLGPSSKLLALLCTCKQIRREASPIFYGANSFRFGPDSMESALQDLSLDTKKQIRALNIALDTGKYQADCLGLVGRRLQPLALMHLKLTLDHRNWFNNYNMDRHNRSRQRSLPLVRTFSDVDELKPFIDLARRAKEVTVFEMNRRGFEDFIRGQLRRTPSPSGSDDSKDSPIDLDD
ncbi:hypothetical protein CKM354_001233800 [Cercospora kikuchii]|uniref:Uncharacterized protein n=1 Tax=Cercospora kikuchii TaxID=84275 RepID=A0A9P3FLT2_9PEZI|nr:uncharacterized protein CKM354_001233800 [Cercospora kikuchii]GIZ49306.1 hypothetical protein CKM354_001233800 [Cercospora kikuchii]